MPSVVLKHPHTVDVRSGFFGKLPARRDFVTGNLPRAVTETWHDWLEDGLVRSRELIGDGWIEAYLNQPVWRFALSAGLCGDTPLMGVMIPNLDKVGRHFPLVIAAVLPTGADPAVTSVAQEDWFEAAEVLALSTLEAGFDFESFVRQVKALDVVPAQAAPVVDRGEPVWPVSASQPCGWQWPTDSGGHPASVFARLFDQVVRGAFNAYSLWWSSGSDVVAAALMAHPGLPGATAFTALLDGQWEQRGWESPRDVGIGRMVGLNGAR